MQNMAENFGAPLRLHMPPNSAQRRMFQKCSTNLAMIAFVLQDSPEKMLTSFELLGKLEAYISGNRKRFQKNIRFCLSSKKCFVKIPARPEITNGKQNYWKLDHGQVTRKMVRRHFKGILDKFPELASKVDIEADRPSEHHTTLHSPEPAACRDVQIKCEVKFSSPFSIESLLKKDSPFGLGSKPSNLSSISSLHVRVEQQPLCKGKGVETKRKFSWDAPPPVEMLIQPAGGSYPIYPAGGNTDHGLIASGNRPVKRIRMCAEPSFLFYTRPSVAPYLTNTQTCYVKYPVPTYCELQHYCL